MAVTTGNDYDHIDIVNGSTQTRHMLKDASARADISDLKSALYDITGATKIENWVEQYRCATNGASIASPSSSATYNYTEVTGCVKGDTFNLTGTSETTGFKLYAWVATDGTIVDKPTENLSYQNVTITCPEGATRLFVNVKRSNPYSLYKNCIPPQISDINEKIDQLTDDVGRISEDVSGISENVSGISENVSKITDDVGQINDDMYQYNAINLIPWTNGTSGTHQGITYTKNDDSWTINGATPSDHFSYRTILDYHEALPDSIVPGRKYKTVIPQDSVPYLQVYFYFSGGTQTGISLEKEDTFTVPVDAIGILIRFRVNASTTVSNQTIKPSIVAVPDWQGEQTIINQTIYNDTYNNDYNITVSPQITTDSNGWLQPIDTDTADETGKTDMTSAIMAMLTETGYCHLAPGIFYVSGNIDMPDGSKIEGCGYKTIVRLLASVSSGYAIKMRKYNTVSNLRISGSYSELDTSSFSGNMGTRHGLLFTTTGSSKHSTVDNIFITDFTGCGIKCYETSTATGNGLYLSQAKIERCQTGIYIEKLSEFNKFEQVNTRDCYIGCENDGGNNMFIGCTFHATNTGFIIDNSLEDKNNNAHGGVAGCTFCHIGNNEGVAIAVKGSANGFTFSDCQIWYCSVLIDNSYGVTFSNIEFGRGVPLGGQTAKGATIDIDGGGTVMFTGCVFMNDVTYPPTINVTNNANVKFTGCYGSHSGNAISA